jgi:branched-subunit amino acid transport protein AzlD
MMVMLLDLHHLLFMIFTVEQQHSVLNLQDDNLDEKNLLVLFVTCFHVCVTSEREKKINKMMNHAFYLKEREREKKKERGRFVDVYNRLFPSNYYR